MSLRSQYGIRITLLPVSELARHEASLHFRISSEGDVQTKQIINLGQYLQSIELPTKTMVRNSSLAELL